MSTNNECPYYGKQFKCECVKMDLSNMNIDKLGTATLTVLDDKIVILDQNGTIEKKWTFLKKEEGRYFFTDQDMSQWIIGEKLISYTIVQTGQYLSFIMV
jgi:hypothetical protein